MPLSSGSYGGGRFLFLEHSSPTQRGVDLYDSLSLKKKKSVVVINKPYTSTYFFCPVSQRKRLPGSLSASKLVFTKDTIKTEIIV